MTQLMLFTGEPYAIPRDADRWPCPHCGGMPLPEQGFEHLPFVGHDPCLGQLDGVRFACCGHGRAWEHPYVVLAGSVVLRDAAALAYFQALGVGP